MAADEHTAQVEALVRELGEVENQLRDVEQLQLSAQVNLCGVSQSRSGILLANGCIL
eukprot:m.180625 g.180625  ORF g.180625 m.180625 type:complete len:57 (+) comp10464_c0_seq25:238-408(+)